MDSYTPLVPQPKIRLRATIVASLLVLGWIGPSGLVAKLIFSLAMAALFGTFPRCRISRKAYEKEWFIGFVPVGTSHTLLADAMQIETDLEQRMGLGGGCLLSIFVGVQNVLMVWLLDWLIPWAGGDYKLWLRTRSDDRVLAWQGNGEDNFRRNLEIIEDVSGLPVTRG